jgi:hypothetical protein
MRCNLRQLSSVPTTLAPRSSMALRNTMRLALLALAVVGAASAGVASTKAAVEAAHLPASFDARDAFYGCADLVLNQARARCVRAAPAARARRVAGAAMR